jgi:Fic family protein
VPLNREAVRDAMPAFFDLLREEPYPAVRVVLGHFIFVYIHPYMDGNGRVGRFLMNTMMASGGYPWTVIPVTDRNAYVNALEKASVGEDIAPFADFLAGLVKKRLAGEPLPPVFALRSRLSVQLNSSCRLRPDVISATPDHEPD